MSKFQKNLNQQDWYRKRSLCVFSLYILVCIIFSLSALISPNASAKLYSRNHTEDIISLPSMPCEIIDKEKFPLHTDTAITEKISNTSIEAMESPVPEETNTSVIESNSYGIPHVMYLHLDENSDDPNFYWIPRILEQKVSDSDIAIDISNFLDSNLAYELSDFEKNLVNLIVHRESNGEPFLGQVLVAEDILNRFRSGLYGPDKIAILAWYGLESDDNGNFHVYNGDKEILEASESVKNAVNLALKGSNISYFLLKATADFQNEKYGLDLGDIYYKYGAMYHFAPRYLTDEKAIKNRTINKIPVSFFYENHVFYGCWISESSALQIF